MLLLLLSLFELLWLTPHFIYIKNICIFLPYIIYKKYFTQIFTLRWVYSEARTQHMRCVHICCSYKQKSKKRTRPNTHFTNENISKRMPGFGLWRILRFSFFSFISYSLFPLTLFALFISHSIPHFAHIFCFVRL